jgi:hypothetical protein
MSALGKKILDELGDTAKVWQVKQENHYQV